jgi:glycerol-3-phosphate O-acyltransferase/dihydroxyacetone phosphate acyltransferase
MALGAVAEHPDMELNIVPVGLNYFAGDRFRSRVYVDYGRPIAVTKELAAQYLQVCNSECTTAVWKGRPYELVG